MASTPGSSEDRVALLLELARQLGVESEQPRPGKELATRPRGELQVREEAARMIRIQARRRARRLPYLATSATATAGYAAWGASELLTVGIGPVGGMLATGCTAALAAGCLAGMRIVYRKRITERWRRVWWTAGTAAAGWITTASAIGPASWPMTACLAAGAAAVSARWLAEHEVPYPHADLAQQQMFSQTELAPIPDGQDEGEVIAELWRTNIAAPNKILPGALLTNRQDAPNAISWTVQTVPGSTSFSEMFARRGRIAAGLHQPVQRVLLEPSSEDESHAWLTIITKDLLAGGVPYPGPRYQGGHIPIGPFADGTGEANYVVCDRVGCRNGLAAGEPGSGKTAFLEAIALALKSSGEWYVVFGDGDPEGGSSPLLNEIADWPEAGPERVLAQLEALEHLLEARSLLKPTLTSSPDGTPVPITDPAAQRPIREMHPCPAFPGVQWIIDELHRLAQDPWLAERKFIKRLERLVRIGRKYGIVALVGTQSLLAPDFGNSTSLRGYLAARNLFAFRTSNKSEKAAVNGLEITPAVLPTGGGYAFAASAGRLAMLRVAWSPDMASWATDLPVTTLDGDSALALAPFLPVRGRDPASLYAEQITRLKAWREAHQRGGDGSQQPTLPGITGQLEVPQALGADNVIQFKPRRRMEDEADLDALNDSQRAVYTALVRGIHRTGEIAAETGLRLPAVSKSLGALADLGLAEKRGHGEWAAAKHLTQSGAQ